MTDQMSALNPRDSKFQLPSRPMEVTITPEMAQDWLDTRNTDFKNRQLSRSIAGRYADAMRRNEWKANHQGIAFDTEGWLIDGQHRLLAVANSGVTVTMWVFPEMPRDTFDTLDVGRRRQASHLIKAPNAAVLASSVKFLAVTDGLVEPRSGGAAFGVLTNVETLDLVRKAGVKLEQAAREANRLHRGARLPQSATAAVIYQILTTESADELAEFTEGVVTGAELAKDDPRLRLRNAFTGSQQARAVAMRTPSHPYALVIKAWNNYLMRRPLQALLWRGDEDIPRVLGYVPTLRDRS